MKYRIPLLLLITLFEGIVNIHQAKGQNQTWREYLEQLAEEEMDGTTIENMYEELAFLESNPINLNAVTRDELQRFPLFSIDQALAVADFLDKNRPVYTVYELRNVAALDYATIERVLPFFYAGEVADQKKETFDQIIKNGKNEIQNRFDKTLTQRAGYGHFSDSILARYPNRKYLGEDFYTSLKYSFTYKDKIQFGIVGEKDAGEPFLKTGYPKGYDHYGFHLIVRDIGLLKTLALGDYRLSFGQGLVLNNDFMISKSGTSNTVIRNTIKPKRHFSTAENGFFRGAAATIGIKNITITAFYSNKRIDATLSEEGSITSFKTDGYHRVPLDMEKKKNTREEVTGMNINYRNNRFQIGINGLYHRFNRMYNPVLRNYNAYYLRDSINANGSIDYSYRFYRFVFAGETAISRNGAVATTNALEWKPTTPHIGCVSLLYRNYSKAYQALYANAFSESSRVQNEEGLYIGSTFYPFPRISLTMFADVIRFPRIRYNVDKPSSALDVYAMASYSFSKNAIFDIRYKIKRKEKNTAYPDEKTTTVLPYIAHKLRVRYADAFKNGWNMRTTVDMNMHQIKYFPKEYGYMISQNIGYRCNDKLTGDFFAGYFHTDTYNTRVYSYERNILNTFYMPSFYGKGIRLALSARFAIVKNLTFSVKGGFTQYSNKEVIGSGTEQINGNSRTDIYTYLRWKF